MASAVPGPPDLITDHAVVQPVDLVNSVQRPAAASLDHQMRVDIVEDLPPSQEDPGVSPDIPTDRLDARGWLGLGRSHATNGASGMKLSLDRPGQSIIPIVQGFLCPPAKMMRSTI